MDRLSEIVKEEEDYFLRLVENKYKEFVIEENIDIMKWAQNIIERNIN